MTCQSRNPFAQDAEVVAKSAGLRRVAAKGLGCDSRTTTNSIDCYQRLQDLSTARRADVGSPPEAAPQRPKDSREPISSNFPPVQPKHGLQAADASLEVSSIAYCIWRRGETARRANLPTAGWRREGTGAGHAVARGLRPPALAVLG